MQMTLYRWSMNAVFLMAASFLLFFYLSHRVPFPAYLNAANLQTFKTMFISIVLEAIPFVLLGVVLSSILQVFVSEQMIRRLIPRNPLLGILFACLLGIIFPVCECGMIPVVRRLIQKGMPVYVAVVFILTGPIINPVVYAATYMAFRTHPELAYTRMGLAFFVAGSIGLILYRTVQKNPLKLNAATLYGQDSSQEHEHPQGNKFSAMLAHASDEFFEMGKFLMFGAILTGLIQTFVVRESLVSIGQGPLSSHLFMMGFAYILSLCSTSDAFVASSFMNTFSKGSLLTFLVLGPMLDFKSTLMLLSVFKTKFVLVLSLLIAGFVLAGSLLFERVLF